jgi:DNA-binding NarL/FixJ family response regulator
MSELDLVAQRRYERGGKAAETIRVMIAASNPVTRAGYRVLLESEERIEVIAEAAGARRAIALATTTHPDVVLLDVGLPDLDVRETIAAIISRAGDAAVMLVAPGETDEFVFRGLEAGAVGVLRNDATCEELMRAVHALAQGGAVLSVAVMRRLLARRHAKSVDPGRLEELTDREKEVMALAATGLSDREIGEQLVVSPKTAKTHISRAMGKLGAHSRAQLVALAYETGLVS